MITLVASAARTVSGNSGALTLPEDVKLIDRMRVVLAVTAAATDAGDTLDVYLQTTYDDVNVDDLAHFTQVLGNGGAKTFIADWDRNVTPENEMHAPQDAAIAAGVVQGGVLGKSLRVKWVIVDAGTVNASFTFSVTAEPVYARRR